MDEKLSKFFDSRRNTNIVPEFNYKESLEIKKLMDSTIKPLINRLAKEISSRENLKAFTIASKRKTDDLIEIIELRVGNPAMVKFIYRPKFIKQNNSVFLISQFQVPDIYGVNTIFKDTDLRIPIEDITAEVIEEDFNSCLISNFD